jgi:hypothetical protein
MGKDATPTEHYHSVISKGNKKNLSISSLYPDKSLAALKCYRLECLLAISAGLNVGGKVMDD